MTKTGMTAPFSYLLPFCRLELSPLYRLDGIAVLFVRYLSLLFSKATCSYSIMKARIPDELKMQLRVIESDRDVRNFAFDADTVPRGLRDRQYVMDSVGNALKTMLCLGLIKMYLPTENIYHE